MSPKKSRLLSLTLPFLILLAGGLGFLALKGLKKQPPKRPTKVQGPLVEVLTVHPVDQQITISATGTVQAWQEVEIVPQVAGKVVWVSPKLVAGGHFARGEILFQIEKKDYEIALEAAEAKVAKAEEALALAKNKALVARRQWQRLYGEKSPPSDLVFYEPQAAHRAGEAFSVRDGVNIARYALKRLRGPDEGRDKKEVIKEAISQILGHSALLFWPERPEGGSHLRPVN